MITFPNCKINLGLNIISKRTDGFHDLETVFYPVPLYDALEIIPFAGNNGNPGVSFASTGNIIDGHPENNLCVRAYAVLKKNSPALPAVQMHLHKVIPAGSGLGGGSADASFTLKLLNKLFDLGISDEQLADHASSLGSDCPFFIINKPCFASGRGEVLEQVNVDLGMYKMLLVNPGIHVHTAKAFSAVVPASPAESIKEIIRRPVEQWKESLKNDFEKTVSLQYPEIGIIRDQLYNAGAVYASMSGSGSTVYGLFEKGKNIAVDFPTHYFVRELTL